MPEVIESPAAAIWAAGELPAREMEPVTAEPEPKREPRLQLVNRNQLLLRTVDVDRLVEPDHLVRAIWELVGRLDLRGFTTDVKAVEGTAGRPPWDPQLLISLWLYAYSEAVSSAREVERRCTYHPVYQWLTGMGEVSHHTLSDFRVEHREALDELFAQLLAAFNKEGLITLQRVMHDGTKVKAWASSDSFHREDSLRAHLEAARERVRAMGDPRQDPCRQRAAGAPERAAREKVEKLEQALQEMQQVQAAQGRAEKSERRVSETDPESRVMKQGDGGYAPSHNVQISTDAAHGLIVGVSVTQSASDQAQLLPALQEIERQTGRLPQQVVVDGGFTTREAILGAAEQGVDLIGSRMQADVKTTTRRLKKRGVDAAFYPSAFHYDSETNRYTCPAGKTLPYQTTKHDRVGIERHVYTARARDCQDCPFRKQCCPAAKSRRIVRSENVPVVAAYVAKMETEEARAIYRCRAPVAEFTNAWLKTKIGLRQFCVRGLQKVRCEVLWACLTYNIQQWFRLRWKARPIPAQA
jgi:transposase